MFRTTFEKSNRSAMLLEPHQLQRMSFVATFNITLCVPVAQGCVNNNIYWTNCLNNVPSSYWIPSVVNCNNQENTNQLIRYLLIYVSSYKTFLPILESLTSLSVMMLEDLVLQYFNKSPNNVFHNLCSKLVVPNIFSNYLLARLA